MSEILMPASPQVDLVKPETFERTEALRQSDAADLTEDEIGENDPDSPRHWSFWGKWSIVGSVALMSFTSVFAPAVIVPTVPNVLESFHVNSGVLSTLLVTIWDLGEGVSPFLMAPLSERHGRLPVFHIGNLLSLGCAIAGALSVNISMLLAFRFLTGLVLPVVAIGPAIIGDLFETEERGFAMSVTFAAIVVADFVSTVIGSYVAQALGWRWTQWLSTIAIGSFGLVSALFMRETYAPKILERKAARLSREGGTSTLSIRRVRRTTTVLESFSKPLKILVESPAALITALCTAVQYGTLSMIFSTLTEVMETTYHISSGSAGLLFLSFAIGNLLATIIYSYTSDRYIKDQKNKKGDTFRPEARLVHLLLATVLLPCGLLLYGWTAEYHVQYIVPLVGVAFGGASLTFALLATETYLVDVYDEYGASAIAAGIALRTVLGTCLPLAAPALYRKIGLGWGNSVLALIAAATIPAVLLLMRHGAWSQSKARVSEIGRP